MGVAETRDILAIRKRRAKDRWDHLKSRVDFPEQAAIVSDVEELDDILKRLRSGGTSVQHDESLILVESPQATFSS